jgi:dienelactone hydrolase
MVAAGVGAGFFWLFGHNGASDWLDTKAIPQIEKDIDGGDWEGAYKLTKAAQARVPDAPELAELWKRFSWRVTLESDPPGAKVYRRAYDAPESAWEELGRTPIKERRIPFGMSRLRLERDGYLPLERLFGSGILLGDEFPTSGTEIFAVVPAETYKLDTASTLPEGKVRVPGRSEVIGAEQVAFDDFFLDRTEVTNAAFKAFVDAGGYRTATYWDPIVRDGKPLPFEEAMALFVDKTGRLGPSTWEAGDYPDGQAGFPVSGVSWYEAAAYARFMRQELPTRYHWRHAFDGASMRWQLPAANLEGSGPRAVNDSKSMSFVGAFDLAGNVREWVANEQDGQRMILGGSYNDPANVAMNLGTMAPALDRSPGNGFRLAIMRDDPHVAELARAPAPQFSLAGWAEPVSDELFAAYSRAFVYEKTPLKAKIEASETTRLWTRQRITFDAAYGGERMMLYLYLPTNGSPPYQTVTFWPGSNAALYTAIDQLGMRLDFVLKSGRAVAFPVFKGMIERGNGSFINAIADPIAYRDLTIEQVKDLRRSIDYLETRSDIDPNAIAYFGHSWGGTSGPAALAHEPHIKAAILYLGFVFPGLEPEIDSINALPRVKVPTLLLNGEFDSVPLENTRHFFSLLGTPPEDKKHVIAIGGHFVPQDVLVRETLDWLDKYLGPPRTLRSDASP